MYLQWPLGPCAIIFRRLDSQGKMLDARPVVGCARVDVITTVLQRLPILSRDKVERLSLSLSLSFVSVRFLGSANGLRVESLNQEGGCT